MKKFSLLILLTLVLVACGTDGHHFEVEGKLTNLNQGEFYVYSPDNVIEAQIPSKCRVAASLMRYHVRKKACSL